MFVILLILNVTHVLVLLDQRLNKILSSSEFCDGGNVCRSPSRSRSASPVSVDLLDMYICVIFFLRYKQASVQIQYSHH